MLENSQRTVILQEPNNLDTTQITINSLKDKEIVMP